jgi:Uma2 family endonuclease
MTVAERPPQRSAAPPDEAAPQPVRWTLDDYYRMADMGLFEGRRVELIEGEVVAKVTQNNPHAAAVTLTQDALRAVFAAGFWIRVQMPLDFAPHSAPEPDVAVVAGTPRGSGPNNPTTALLVVEVSDTTLAHDRRRKGAVYARAGIADYWIVNLVDRCLEVRRGPVADPAAEGGHRYAETQVFSPADSVSPLAAPQGRIAVADLLP